MELVEGRARIEDVEAFLAEVGHIEDEHGVTIQAFDARYIAGREHIERAVTLAARAIDRGETIARDSGVEILLYAAGRRQINRALVMGVSEGECPIVAVVVSDWRDTDIDDSGDGATRAASAVRDLLEPAETLSAYDEQRVCEFFDISDTEREATAGSLADLVCERVALLVVDR